jgi:hypothetical protein
MHETTATASLLVQGTSDYQAGQSASLRLMLHAADGTMLKHFDVVHEKKVHLVIVREGLDTFAHLHPQVDDEGNLVVQYTFPVGGDYRLYADFQSVGQMPATASTRIRVAGDSPVAPPLTANVPGFVMGDGLNAKVAVERARTSSDATIRFEIVDPNEQPIQNLQPYLGAKGHLQIISSDGQEYVHAHPIDAQPSDASNVVVFHAAHRKGGIFKGWGQFQRGAAIHVVPFVVDLD